MKDGDVYKSKDGVEAVVLDCSKLGSIKIQFLDEHKYEYTVSKYNLVNGKIRNPYHPSVYGVGYVGIGEHHTSFQVDKTKSKQTRVYEAWNRMMQRCYDTKVHKISACYMGCTVAEEWHNFQVFAEWFFSNPEWKNKDHVGAFWQLDKDIVKCGNKVYSKDTCLIVPAEINLIFSPMKVKGKQVGVTKTKTGTYLANMSKGGRNVSLGSYKTEKEATDVYIKNKLEHIYKTVDKYPQLSEHAKASIRARAERICVGED